MPELIFYDDPDAWEENKEQVNNILKELGLEDGDGYFELPNSSPPIIFVPGGIDEDSEARFNLAKLEGVTVQHEDGD